MTMSANTPHVPLFAIATSIERAGSTVNCREKEEGSGVVTLAQPLSPARRGTPATWRRLERMSSARVDAGPQQRVQPPRWFAPASIDSPLSSPDRLSRTRAGALAGGRPRACAFLIGPAALVARGSVRICERSPRCSVLAGRVRCIYLDAEVIGLIKRYVSNGPPRPGSFAPPRVPAGSGIARCALGGRRHGPSFVLGDAPSARMLLAHRLAIRVLNPAHTPPHRSPSNRSAPPLPRAELSPTFSRRTHARARSVTKEQARVQHTALFGDRGFAGCGSALVSVRAD